MKTNQLVRKLGVICTQKLERACALQGEWVCKLLRGVWGGNKLPKKGGDGGQFPGFYAPSLPLWISNWNSSLGPHLEKLHCVHLLLLGLCVRAFLGLFTQAAAVVPTFGGDVGGGSATRSAWKSFCISGPWVRPGFAFTWSVPVFRLPNNPSSEVKVPHVAKALSELYIAFVVAWAELIIMAFVCCKYINTLLWDRACFHYAGSCGTQELLPTREVLSEMSPGDYHLPALHVFAKLSRRRGAPTTLLGSLEEEPWFLLCF